MTKAVFRPDEVTVLEKKVLIETPASYPDLDALAPEEEKAGPEEAVEEYSGPTAEDLRREAEAFKEQWEAEKDSMIAAAKAAAEDIVKEAEEAAAGSLRRNSDEGETLKRQAGEEAERIIARSKEEAAKIENEVRAALAAERKEAEDQGREAGRTEGFAEGKAEVERLIERTQIVLERAQDKRAEILAETEREIVDLVLLIARKVVKVISDNQRSVIVSNVVQALRKVRGRGDVIIRVNLSDLKLATGHTKDFIQLLEGVKSVQVLEDSSVDPGGCIIETDFGEIDARIASQLAELEAKILEISPIKSKQKPAGAANGLALNGLASNGTSNGAARAAAATKAMAAAAESAAAEPAVSPAAGEGP
ncbi:MAG: flagellar assembly protein FliH [Treponema sp.]|jgi:flagellar assembly protein FliH|nr:flagellar assembly protein FliH [Treponema sp.]